MSATNAVDIATSVESNCAATRPSVLSRSPPLPMGDKGIYYAHFGAAPAVRRSIGRGESLFRQGDTLKCVYEILAGQFKSSHTDRGGRCQITGFQMTGELLGLDGFGADHHCSEAVALESSLVSVIPYDELNELLRESATGRLEIYRVMSREIVRGQAMMLILGTMNAEERIAYFVLDMTLRLHARGYSALSQNLRMTRREIGNYLGLRLETVSRTFSKLHNTGVLDVNHRNVHVIDTPALRRIARQAPLERIDAKGMAEF